jgi:DNA-binding response OmpR family regulator
LVHQKPGIKLIIVKKILVIEDDQDIADIVEMALAEKYLVKTQTDNNLILDSFVEFRPDLVLVDNQIGQRYAYEIVSEIKSINDYNNIPFVLFSGHEDIRRIATEIAANAYLPKPFALVDLYKCIDVVLSKCA